MNMSLIKMYEVTKKFVHKKRRTYALKGVHLKVEKGDFMVVIGPSGSGKTTLLNMMSGMDHPTKGTVLFKDRNFMDLTEDEKAVLRKENLGFVFQFFNLIDHLTVQENVEIPLLTTDIPRREIRERAFDQLANVDPRLIEKKDRSPVQLSGGEKQRVAIARALVNNPEILMADEPVAQLERETADKILDLFKGLNTKGDKTIVVVTTDERLFEETKDVVTKEVRIEGGEIQEINE